MRVPSENQCSGTGDWWGAPHAAPGAVEAYTTQPSVVGGDALEVCVSTQPPARYRLSAFRLGWYDGLGGRLMRAPTINAGMPRDAPPPDPGTGIVRAQWPVTDVLQTDESWPSGQYIMVLELINGPHAGSAARVPFVVRGLPDETAPILVQTPINTAQAYNHWGGKSLYASNSTEQTAAVSVSFDRPVPCWGSANLNARAPFVYELPMIRWLEREGFDIEYQTNVDTHRYPFSLSGRQLIISIGHDEYWTREMRAAFDDALAEGTSLAFMGANTCYWQMRYEDDERTIVAYKDKGALDPERDPALKTIRFRDLTPARPERELVGQQYEGGIAHPREPAAYRFVSGFRSDPWAQGVALDDQHSLEGLVGYEWDTLDERKAHPGTVRIMHGALQPTAADCIRWTAPSGAHVFSAGSLQFAWGLDDWASPSTADPRLQQIMARGLKQMLGAG
jgi:hypothetical protein